MAVELCVTVVPLTVSELKGAVPPTAPLIVTAPLPVKVRALAPLIVLEKDKTEPVSITAPVSVTGPLMAMGLAVVVKFPPKLMAGAV